jgi:hypothetical protein
MVKTEAAKGAKMMRKEWWKSKSTEMTINDLVGLGVLHNRELAGWRPAGSDNYPNPWPSEIVVFEDFFKRGFRVPIHPFLQGLCLFYEIGICNLHPNAIFLVSVFIHLCEVYVGIQPHFDLFRYLFCLRKKVPRRLQNYRWSVPDAPRWDEARVPELYLEHLSRRLVQEVVLHSRRA